MPEQTYNKVFQLIQESLVPKTQLEEYQNNILHLESILQKTARELETIKSEYKGQKLTIEIIQAEKNSLQAEKKAIEVKFNEVSLKLQQKSNQYDLLLQSNASRERDTTTQSLFVLNDTPKVKKEPSGISIVNVPASLSSKSNGPSAKTASKQATTKTGTKRQTASSKDDPQRATKRKKVEEPKTSQNTEQPVQMNPKITCNECLDDWGRDVVLRYEGNPDHSCAPDPRQKIATFTSFATYRRHLRCSHAYLSQEIDDDYCYPNSDFLCNSCGCSFECKRIFDNHIEFEHAILDLTNQEFFALYSKYLRKMRRILL